MKRGYPRVKSPVFRSARREVRPVGEALTDFAEPSLAMNDKDRAAVDARPSAQIEIVLNGRPLLTAATDLAALLDEQGYAGVKVATARNGTFVPDRRRTTEPLAAGDHVEVVSARQGG